MPGTRPGMTRWLGPGRNVMTIQGQSRYHEAHARSLRDPEGFWGEAAREIDWIEPAKKIFDPALGPYGRWFAGGVVNTCYNALDRHVAGGRADQVALIHDSPLAGRVTKFTYAQLLDEVKTLAAVMQDFGVAKGDRVILYMPMVPEAVVAMLACARIGAVHSVVFGGFAAKELATRIEDAKPKLIFSASCGLEPGRIVQYKPLLDEAIKLSSVKPEACIILQRPQQSCELAAGRDHDWTELRSQAIAAKKSADCMPVSATDPLYILYTSGTTGIPKGVVRDNGGHLVALKWSMFNLYGVKPGEVWWCGSDIGWVVGTATSSTGRCFMARPQSCMRASRSARRMQARSGASFPSTRRLPSSPRRPRSGPSRRKTRTESSSANTTFQNSARCFSPASAPIRRRWSGRKRN